MSKPIAVLISDVHYNLQTIEVADEAMGMAITKANKLSVPLVVAGDLHDTKANLRGECVNAIIETLKHCATSCYILRGNHDSLNEKSTENALSFLNSNNCFVINIPKKSEIKEIYGSVYLIPYHHDADVLRTYLKTIPKTSTLIMHQGLIGSNASHYIQDRSAISKEDVKDFRVISGHYHARQTIKCRNESYLVKSDFGGVIKYKHTKKIIGTWDYLGNPFTLGFGEAKHDNKGYSVLFDDGALKFIPTNLRKHIVYETDASISGLAGCPSVRKKDLLWVKVTGAEELRQKFTKKFVRDYCGLDEDYNFKFDYISLKIEANKTIESTSHKPDILDNIITSLTNVTEDQKKRLKTLWKDLCVEDTDVRST